jgi:hypothetical protein
MGMGTGDVSQHVQRPLGGTLTTPSAASSARAAARPASIEDATWLAALATAALAVLAIRYLGPVLGETLLRPAHAYFWSNDRAIRPEPVEQGRFLVALSVPLVLAMLTAAAIRLRLPDLPPATGLLVGAAQVTGVAFAVVCLLQQHSAFGPLYPHGFSGPRVHDNFPLSTLCVAAAGAIVLLAAVRSVRIRDAWERWTPETGARRLVASCVAVAVTAVWMLHAANTEGTIGHAHSEVLFNVYTTLDETFAVLDGRSPLVDYVTQYSALWPYAYAAVMSLLGASVGVWVTLAVCTTALGMLAIFGALRRVAGSSINGLLLFLPVLATSFLMLEGTSAERYTFGNYYGTFPLRYAGPSMLAWLVARHLDGARPRRMWPLFLAAGLVALNNVDVGIAALGATVAAVLWADDERSRASVRRLVLQASAGLGGALLVVSILTLARAGELPDIGLLFRFPRLFGRLGYALFPMPTLGLHVVIYLTYVAAIGVATVRFLRTDPDRLLTGMLAWSGVFGLGASAYFAGRSTPDDLPALFFPWSFTIVLLLIPALRTVRDAAWRRPPVASAACLFAFVLLCLSLAQTPAPWTQIERLRRTARPVLAVPAGQAFVARHTRPGERVLILGLLGHRIGANLGVVDVSPYSNTLAMKTSESLQDAIAALRAAGGRKVFLDLEFPSTDFRRAILRAGFEPTDVERHLRTALLVSRRRR